MPKIEQQPLQRAVLRPFKAVGKCRWWLLCENDAAAVESHPILGDVPICERCQAKLRAMQ